MKRLMAMPQLVLGLAFAWGGLMGFAAAFGHLAAPALLLYAAAIVWTIGYDTVYAMQDLEDDHGGHQIVGALVRGARASRHRRLLRARDAGSPGCARTRA